MQFGFPYQYKQSHLKEKLFYLNFGVRLLLSRVLPFLISPPAFLMVQNHKLSYSEVGDRAAIAQCLFLLGHRAMCMQCNSCILH